MVEVKIIKVSITQMGFAIVLKSSDYQGILPIFIAPLETAAISNALDGQKSERPMTHDLGKSIITRLGATLEKVLIDNYSNGIYYAKLILRVGHKSTFGSIEVDARPSDAVALAIRFHAPIFVSNRVYREHSVNIDLRALEFSEEKFFDSLTSMLSREEVPSDDLMGAELVDSILEEFAGAENPSKDSEQVSQDARNYKDKKQVLEQMLKNAIAKEQYEEAAQLRDEINDFSK